MEAAMRQRLDLAEAALRERAQLSGQLSYRIGKRTMAILTLGNA